MSSPRYPVEYEADVELSDGGTAFVRPVKPEDGEAFVEFHGRQSAESIYYRFFSPHPTLSDAEVEHFVTVDHRDRFALVALLDERLIGVARYDRPEASHTAEVAFFIDDEHHGRGLATILLEHLAEAARDRGINGFWATVLPDNRRMVSVFRQAGFGVTSRFSDGLIEVELTLEPTEEAREAIESRARKAQQAAVRRILNPQHVVVIGASTTRDGLGRRLLDSVLDHEFKGEVSVVHPLAAELRGVEAHASVLDIEGEIDLAVIAVPAANVVEVADECGRAGVAAALVITAGFADAGEQGRALQAQLLTVVRRHGMRLIGPNSLGIINTDPAVDFCATFAPVSVTPGGVAIMSQSGTLGAAILDRAAQLGLGVSSFVSVGNKADVSGNDLLTYWGADPRTDLVLLYLESFGNPRRFARIVREVSLSTPVLAVKAGRDREGPSELDDAIVDTLLERQGVVRVEGVARLLDVARVISCQGVPRGPRLALIGNSGGSLRLAADAARSSGLTVVAEDDLGWDAATDDYVSSVRAVLDDDAADLVLVVFAPADWRSAASLFEKLHEISVARPEVTFVASVFGSFEPSVPPNAASPIPVFEFPDDAVVAAGHAVRYGRWRLEADGPLVDLELETSSVRAAVTVLATHGVRLLDLEQAAALLGECDLGVTPFGVVATADEAAAAATEIGYPVVLKAGGVDGPARREAEGASLDLHDDEAVRAAFGRMESEFGEAMKRAVVQRMAPAGVDLAIGVTVEPGVGPVIWTDATDHGPHRSLVPLTESGLDDLLVPELEGADRVAAGRLVATIAAIAEAVPELTGLRLAPVVVSGGVAAITNVRIEIAPDRRPDGPEVRRLDDDETAETRL